MISAKVLEGSNPSMSSRANSPMSPTPGKAMKQVPPEGRSEELQWASSTIPRSSAGRGIMLRDPERRTRSLIPLRPSRRGQEEKRSTRDSQRPPGVGGGRPLCPQGTISAGRPPVQCRRTKGIPCAGSMPHNRGIVGAVGERCHSLQTSACPSCSLTLARAAAVAFSQRFSALRKSGALTSIRYFGAPS